eukprot:c5367_g1_i1.p1 GENE.c5367_g1_i1~~c5367_g1_i1.p1  ORF type:complete len:333 (-),score=60.37 c5367_g1_i1:543-1475(-)
MAVVRVCLAVLCVGLAGVEASEDIKSKSPANLDLGALANLFGDKSFPPSASRNTHLDEMDMAQVQDQMATILGKMAQTNRPHPQSPQAQAPGLGMFSKNPDKRPRIISPSPSTVPSSELEQMDSPSPTTYPVPSASSATPAFPSPQAANSGAATTGSNHRARVVNSVSGSSHTTTSQPAQRTDTPIAPQTPERQRPTASLVQPIQATSPSPLPSPSLIPVLRTNPLKASPIPTVSLAVARSSSSSQLTKDPRRPRISVDTRPTSAIPAMGAVATQSDDLQTTTKQPSTTQTTQTTAAATSAGSVVCSWCV